MVYGFDMSFYQFKAYGNILIFISDSHSARIPHEAVTAILYRGNDYREDASHFKEN